MDPTEVVDNLVSELATVLESAAPPGPDAQAFVGKVIAELRLGQLTRNEKAPSAQAPKDALQPISDGIGKIGSERLRDAVEALWPHCPWIGADRFYPEPEHEHFSKKMWGAMIVGENDALFTAEQRYIVLLIVIAPNTTYPLHAHRIEEAYYVLAGQADWSHDGEAWTTLPPGSIFFNRSYEPHTMRTSDEPLIAMGFYLPPFGWEGGLIS